LIDLRPVVFATALARVLEEHGYEVDFDRARGHDLAIVDADAEATATVQIRIPALDGSRRSGILSKNGSTRRVTLGSLEDLLGVVGREMPIVDGLATGRAD